MIINYKDKQMKKIQYLIIPAIFLISVILLTHFNTSDLWGKNSSSQVQEITTNYHDLPASQQIILKSLLDTSDLTYLNEDNLQLMGRYLVKHLLHTRSQFETNIESNYFWYIYNALPEFVDKSERHHGYYENQNDQNQADRLLAYAIYRIDRSPENLKRIFAYVRPLIKTTVSQEFYERGTLGDKVSVLLAIHSELVKIENYKEKMLSLSARTDMITGKTASSKDFSGFKDSAYGFTSWDLAQLICSELGIISHDNYYCTPDWSFWMRRIREGNMEAVHSILVEISEMYR